jgi:hypothetical protein
MLGVEADSGGGGGASSSSAAGEASSRVEFAWRARSVCRFLVGVLLGCRCSAARFGGEVGAIFSCASGAKSSAAGGELLEFATRVLGEAR